MTETAAQIDVLIVDDAVELRDMLADVFRYEGLSALGADNGLVAKRQLEAGLRPRVIVLDMMMPEMDGASFLEWLRASPFSTLPVVMVTAALEPPPLEADVFFRKPVDVDELVEAVKLQIGPR